MQTHGISTEIRDIAEALDEFWTNATRNGRRLTNADLAQTTRLIRALSPLAAQQDDGMRLAASAIKGGNLAPATIRRRRDYEGVHGPLDIDAYRRRRILRLSDSTKRPDRSTDPSAA